MKEQGLSRLIEQLLTRFRLPQIEGKKNSRSVNTGVLVIKFYRLSPCPYDRRVTLSQDLAYSKVGKKHHGKCFPLSFWSFTMYQQCLIFKK